MALGENKKIGMIKFNDIRDDCSSCVIDISKNKHSIKKLKKFLNKYPNLEEAECVLPFLQPRLAHFGNMSKLFKDLLNLMNHPNPDKETQEQVKLLTKSIPSTYDTAESIQLTPEEERLTLEQIEKEVHEQIVAGNPQMLLLEAKMAGIPLAFDYSFDYSELQTNNEESHQK